MTRAGQARATAEDGAGPEWVPGAGSSQAMDAQLRALLRDYLAAYAAVSPPATAAVVGNAPLEPSPGRAEAIDSADLVIRMNSFAVDGPSDPPSHGRRVDVVIFSRGVTTTPHFFDRYRTRGFLMTEASQCWKAAPRPTQHHFPEDLGYWPVPNRAVLDPLRDEIWPERGVEEVDPTTGTVAAWLIHSLFPDAELLIAGLSFLDEVDRETWTHHVNQREVKVPVAHRVDREGALINRWVRAGEARILT